MIQELDIGSISGFLEFLAYQGKTGTPEDQQFALDLLRGTIEGLPETMITAEDAVTVQALGVTILQSVISEMDNLQELRPEQAALIRGALGHLLIIMLKTATALEAFSGARMADRQFFGDMTPTSIQ